MSLSNRITRGDWEQTNEYHSVSVTRGNAITEIIIYNWKCHRSRLPYYFLSNAMTSQPWGTITRPPFELGFQKLDAGEIEKVVDRLSRPKTTPVEGKRRSRPAIEKRQLSKEEINTVVARLADKEANFAKTPDTRRINRFKKEWGAALNSYAWNGCNHQAILCGEESP